MAVWSAPAVSRPSKVVGDIEVSPDVSEGSAVYINRERVEADLQVGLSWRRTKPVGFEVESQDSVSPKLLLYLRLLYEDPLGPGACGPAVWVTTRNTKS